MNTDQLETIGQAVAQTTRNKFALDYIRFDAGAGTNPWATLFLAKRGYVTRRHHEFPTAQVQQWLTLPESQAREAICTAIEERATALLKETADPPLVTVQAPVAVQRDVPVAVKWVALFVAVVVIGMLLAHYLSQQHKRLTRLQHIKPE